MLSGGDVSASETPRALYFYTGLGLLLGFGFLIIPASAVFHALYSASGLPWLTIFGLNDVSLKVIIVIALLAMVLYGERRPLSSIGMRRPHLSDIALGIGAVALGELAMYLTELLLPHGFASSAEGAHALFTRLPLWLMLLVSLVNGIFEEIVARGFAVERLGEVTHSTIAGASIALALNLAAHLPYWGWRQTIIIAPGLATFLALYLWRRSVVPCAIAHILNDAFPALVGATAVFVLTYVTPYLSYDRQGSIYYTKGDFDRSIQLFTKAIAKDPGDSYAFNWRGLTWLNKKDNAKCFSDLAEAIRLDPRNASVYGDRAFAYTTTRDNQHALADLNKAIALEPRSANWYEMKAGIESKAEDWAAAIRDYDHAIGLDSTDADLYGERAYAEYLNGDYELAIRDYYTLVRYRPKDEDAWSDLARAYDANQEYYSALEALSQALKINPRSSYAYHRRGELYFRNHDYSRAEADWEEALKLNPDDSATYNSMAWLLSTNPEPKIRDGKRAVELAQKACKLNGWEDGEIIDTLAAAYAESGDFTHAVEFQTKAIALAKSDPEALKEMRARLALYQKRLPYRESQS
jgi:tetratricopeptide (TPR) repeat protein